MLRRMYSLAGRADLRLEIKWYHQLIITLGIVYTVYNLCFVSVMKKEEGVGKRSAKGAY